MAPKDVVNAKWHAQAVRDALATLICANGSHAIEIAATTKAHTELRKLAESLGYELKPVMRDAA